MKILIQIIQKAFNIHSVMLPKEGTIYTHKKRGCAYNGMTGIVRHHDCGTRFMIDTGSSWLCDIKPF